MLQTRSEHTATVLPGGKLLVVGGRSAMGSLATAEVYDPATRTWSSTGSLAQARTGHTATLLNNGKVLVTGGRATAGPLASAEVYNPATGTWSPTSALSEARSDHVATLLSDGKVLVAGGKDSMGAALASAKLYDPATGTWSPAGSLNQGRSDHTATVLPNGKVLVTGGKNSAGSLDSTPVYDPVTKLWSAASSLAHARTGHTATVLSDGGLLVTGGSDPAGHLASAEIFAPAVGAWSPTGSLHRVRGDHTATILPGGRVLVTGGRDTNGPLGSAEVYDMATRAWGTTDSLVQARTGHTATLLPDGQVLVAGGSNSAGYLSSVEVYFPAPGAWRITDSLNQVRAGHTATPLADGKVLVVGGKDAAGPVATARVYEPATGTWGPTGSLPQARTEHTATLLKTGKVLVVGGKDAAGPVATARVYDPATRAWSTTGSLAQPRTGHAATLLADGKVLVTGGKAAAGPLASAEEYNPATGTWAAATPLAEARSGHTATVSSNGKVLVTGGQDAAGFLASVRVYDPATRAWSPTGSLAQARTAHTATLLSDGKVLVTGGEGAFNQLTSAEVYDPSTGDWHLTGALTQPRAGHTGTLLPGGKVLVTGGYGSFSHLASTEVYDPSTATWSLTGSLNQARTGHTGTPLPAGTVLVTGGTGAGGLLASSEVYDPARADYTAAAGTSLTAAPASLSNEGSATFRFNSKEGATFECSLDETPFEPCGSPATYEGLTAGVHLFQVRVLHGAGSAAATPAWHSWTVDLTAPESLLSMAQISSFPQGPNTFHFASDDVGARFECSLNDADFSPCVSPATYTGLGHGTHVFQVRALDAAGNADPTPASHPWSLTAPQPETPDAGVPDPGTPDSGTPAPETPDAGVPDPGTPDAGTPVPETPEEEQQPDTQGYGPPPEDLDGLAWAPQFEPDYNTLQPQPWVEVTTPRQAQTVVVTPEKLIFPRSENPEVLRWEAGKVVVSAPSAGSGSNPLGFARRVRSVAVVGDTIEVLTEPAALQDIVTGELQVRFDLAQMQEVDLSKLDLEWAANNLYVNAPVLSPELGGDLGPSNYPTPDLDANWQPLTPGDPFFGALFGAIKRGAEAVGNFIGGAARSIADAATNLWRTITPDSFAGSVSLSENMSKSHSNTLFLLHYRKHFERPGHVPMDLIIRGQGHLAGGVSFKPGVQVGMRIPNIGHDTPFSTWLNVDSQFRSSLDVDIELETEVASAEGLTGNALWDQMARDASFAGEVLSLAREEYLGDPDLMPAGGLGTTLMISRPSVQIVWAGPVPVILTQTFQIDLECGFAAKAGLKADISFEHNTNLRFSTRYERGAVTTESPSLTTRKSSSTIITGGGQLSLACSLIPRVNVFVYDTAGLNAGVRGSLVATAGYETKCDPGAQVSKPKVEVSMNLNGNLGLQVGGRLQAPFASFSGKSRREGGIDIGPYEVWSTGFPIYERVWTLNGGLGYCTPLCRNTVKDGLETDLNCGGGACDACGEGQQCELNTDCATGFCSAGRCSSNHCGDGVRDGDETGIDCGGARCSPCGVSVGCFLPRDCASGFCAVEPGTGSLFGRCVQNHCADYVRDADEGGIDCGGSSCPKCAVGARCAVAADCITGLSSGEFCSATTCRDRVRSEGETDIDCGGTSTCERCGKGQQCVINGDCAASAPVCDRTFKVCSVPLCGDSARNGDETDVDCGGSCGTKCAENKSCLQNSDCVTGLVCDPELQACIRLPTCEAGQYLSGRVCVDAGLGYWAPSGATARYACTNTLPANAVYTNPRSSTSECAWTCAAGYRNVGGQCEPKPPMQVLQCADDELAVGIYGKEDQSVDSLGLLCSRFVSGQVSSTVVPTGTVGGTGGNEFYFRCPAGWVLEHVEGDNGWQPSSWSSEVCQPTTLASIGFKCANPVTGEQLPENELSFTTAPSELDWGYQRCWTPVETYSFTCPVGKYVAGLSVLKDAASRFPGFLTEVLCR